MFGSTFGVEALTGFVLVLVGLPMCIWARGRGWRVGAIIAIAVGILALLNSRVIPLGFVKQGPEPITQKTEGKSEPQPLSKPEIDTTANNSTQSEISSEIDDDTAASALRESALQMRSALLGRSRDPNGNILEAGPPLMEMWLPAARSYGLHYSSKALEPIDSPMLLTTVQIAELRKDGKYVDQNGDYFVPGLKSIKNIQRRQTEEELISFIEGEGKIIFADRNARIRALTNEIAEMDRRSKAEESDEPYAPTSQSSEDALVLAPSEIRQLGRMLASLKGASSNDGEVLASGMRERIINAMQSDSKPMRMAAILAAWDSDWAGFDEPLLKLLNDHNPQIRTEAAVCLAKLGCQKAVPLLRAMSQTDESGPARAFANGALEMLSTKANPE